MAQAPAANTPPPVCEGFGTSLDEYNLRIASMFIILVGSLMGVFLPTVLARTAPHWRFSQLAFFLCKYFGTGVILSTAFMHLLSPAVEALSDECLRSYISDFDWAHAICLITIMTMFFLELVGTRFNFDLGQYDTTEGTPDEPGDIEREPLLPLPMPMYVGGDSNDSSIHGSTHAGEINDTRLAGPTGSGSPDSSAATQCEIDESANGSQFTVGSYTRMVSIESSNRIYSTDFLSKPEAQYCLPTSSPRIDGVFVQESRPDFGQNGDISNTHETTRNGKDRAVNGSYSVQIMSLLVLEFGVVFHSLFIGLSLAGSDNIRLLLTVLTFHQFFEGLGLGARLAVVQWPTQWRAWTGVGMGLAYGITTPLGIAIGLLVNTGIASRPAVGQLMNGIFDSVSAGILVYTALVELLAHEFMFSEEMRAAPVKKQQAAFVCVVLGAAAMILLAKWA